MIGETNDNAGAHDLLNRVFDRRARELVDDLEDVGDWTERRFIVTPAGQFFRDRVHESNATECVGDDDAIADARERDGKQIFLALNFGALLFDFGPGRFARRDRAHDAPIGPANEKQIRQSGESESDRACACGGIGRAMFRFQRRFLLILQPLDFAAQFVHRLAPESLSHDFGCGVESVFFAQCNGLGQLVQLRVGQVFDRA